MAKELVFMNVQGPQAVMLQPAVAARVATPVAINARAVKRQPAQFRDPAVVADMKRVRPDLITTLPGRDTIPRDQVHVPICPVPEPADTVLYEDAATAEKRYYLPRYRLREVEPGRYDFAVTATQDGGWRLSLGLQRMPAPELGTAAQGASVLPHSFAVFFRYGEIEKRVDFVEPVEDAKGVTVSVRLTTLERDSLLHALKTDNTNAPPALIVRRAISVAVKVSEQPQPQPPRTLVRINAARVESPQIEPEPALEAMQPLAATVVRDHRAGAAVSADRVSVNRVGANRVILRPPPPVVVVPPADRYRVVQRALDDIADPEPFLLDPILHPYVYAVAGGNVTASGFRRIPLAYPQGATDARLHAYFQDRAEPWVFYYLPDRFKLTRRDVAPFLPQIAVRIDAPDSALENARVTVDYWVEPSVDPARLETAAAALQGELRADPSWRAELRPLASQQTRLQLWVPGPSGATLAETNVPIDLANGFFHSLSMPLDDFRQLYAAAYSRGVSSLFTGSVLVETSLSKEIIPLAVRFADTVGEILTFSEAPEGDAINVQMENAIESPVRISSLPVRVRRGTNEVAAHIEGIAFTPPLEVAPEAKLLFKVRPDAPLPGDGPLDVILDTSKIEVLPDAEKILPLISDNSVPAQYERRIDVMTMPELLGEAADPTAILLVNVEFKGGVNLRVSREHAEGSVQVRLPLIDLLLGRDVQGRYGFRQQIVRRNGSQSVDPSWREADFGLLVVPVA